MAVLASTLGTGNIIGVATAIIIGGAMYVLKYRVKNNFLAIILVF